MRIAIVTDAWLPQINGVVRTLGKLCGELEKRGHEICLITPSDFRTLPCPSYPEIRLAVMPGRGVRKALDDFAPEAIHVSTEGPLGLAGRRYCVKHGFPFSTSYHTRFPEYLSARVPVPLSWGYAFMRAFTRQVTGVEEFKVVCYEASTGGHFKPHRDNRLDYRAHRRFALSINLNTGDYEGGVLRFPEYGPDLYRPPRGDAIIYSSSLLHEVTPVTSGRRFALLAHMFDDESRQRNPKFRT